MDILVYGSARPGSLGEMCVRGLENLGHDVSFFARSYPHRLVGRVAARLPGAPALLNRARRRAFLARVGSVDPDLLLVLKGYGIDASLVEEAVARSDVVAVNWNPDNPFQHRAERTRAETYLDALSAYDVAYTWGEFLVDDLRAEGATDVRVLPFAHDPALHHPTETVPEYDCEVSFVGYWSEKRERLLTALTPFDLQVRGPRWREECDDAALSACVAGDAVRGEEYTHAMSSADAVVNVLGDHNVPGHNMRTFEAPASGSLAVTTRTEGQKRFFNEAEDVVMYDGPEELRESVARYLNHPEEREAVASSGLEAVEPHTYQRRMERVVEDVREYL